MEKTVPEKMFAYREADDDEEYIMASDTLDGLPIEKGEELVVGYYKLIKKVKVTNKTEIVEEEHI